VSEKPRIMEGHFWRPDEGSRFYGRLEHDLERGVIAHFVDTDLIERSSDGPEAPAVVDTLWGEALGGMPLTIQDFRLTSWRLAGMRESGDDVIDGTVTRLLRGVHLPAGEEPPAAITVASLKGLREFLLGGIVDGGPLPIPGEDLRGEVLNIALAEGVDLQLVVHRNPAVAGIDRHSEVVASAQWNLDPPLPLGELEERWIRPLCDLILFATRSQSYLASLNVNPDPEGQGAIKVFQAADPRPRETPKVYALALNLADHEDPAELVRSWFELRRKTGPVWGLFFSALDRSESLLEDRLLGLLAFAEGYDRAMRTEAPLSKAEEKAAKAAIKKALPDKRVRAVYRAAVNHANTKTLRERLAFLIERATSVLYAWDLDASLLCNQLYETRNWMIHWGERGVHVVDAAGEMVLLVRRLIVVLYINLLLDLGLDDEAAARVIGSGWRLEGLP
jgi:hypothetical protein